MTQKFPEITQDGYIDTGIVELQDRDNAVLTLFAGESAPSNPFQNVIWNDLSNNSLKWYNNNDWEVIIDYSVDYSSKNDLTNNYQRLNSKLTSYSNVNPTTSLGFINTRWIPMSRFVLDNFFVSNSLTHLDNKLGLGDLSRKSSLTSTDIGNRSISIGQINGEIITEKPFNTGDIISTLSSGNKTDFVKLSKSKNVVYTIGSTLSNAIYLGNSYKNLYEFIWENLDLHIYTSNGLESTKGNTWLEDWNNNKKLELPHIDTPEEDVPADFTANYGENLDYTVSKSGYYEVTLVGGGGYSDNTSVHSILSYRSYYMTGASGAGFKAQILLNEGDVLTYTIGKGGARSEGTNGNGSWLYLNYVPIAYSDGGQSGKALPTMPDRYGGEVTIFSAAHFYSVISNITGANAVKYTSVNRNEYLELTVDGPFLNDYGKGASVIVSSSPVAYDGNSGFFGIKFLAPKEYGTPDSDVKTKLDAFYEGISYFMKL